MSNKFRCMKSLYQKLKQFLLVKPDGPEALDMEMEMLMEKAQSGHAAAQYEIGQRYFYGEYYLKDIPAALRWLELAATQHHVQAQSLLCQYYYPRLNDHSSYTDKLIDWASHAAYFNDVEAQAIWGEILIMGLASQQASVECVHYLTLAAKKEHLRAAYLLGTLYLHAKWVDKNIEKARYWIENSAKRGYTPSQALLSEMYRKGIGVEQNTIEADFWLSQTHNK